MAAFDNPEVYKSVLETLPTGVYLVDRNRKIRFWNAGAERICGYLGQDVVGRSLPEHLLASNDETEPGEDVERDPLDLVLRDGKSSTARVSILHKEGYRVPIVLQTVPIRNEHGAVIGAAECFEVNVSVSERTRRRTMTGGLMCLDEVTGLPSRNSMETHLRERLVFAAQHHAEFGILLIEIEQLDHLRAVRGPSVIPTVLRIVSMTIENSLRPTDVVGTWSNNAFVVALPECGEADLKKVGNRIQKMISQSEVEWWGDRFSVAAAVGGAGYQSPDDTVELLIERSNRALAAGREAGRDHVTVDGPTSNVLGDGR